MTDEVRALHDDALYYAAQKLTSFVHGLAVGVGGLAERVELLDWAALNARPCRVVSDRGALVQLAIDAKENRLGAEWPEEGELVEIAEALWDLHHRVEAEYLRRHPDEPDEEG